MRHMGKINVTMKDVARRAGVSQPTVSRVINDSDSTLPIAPATRRKVWKAIKELNYVPNVAARSLVTRETKNIGLLFFKERDILLTGPFFSKVFQGLEEETTKNGYHLIVSCVDNQAEEEIPRLIREHRVDGVILMGMIDKERVERIPRSVPFAAMVDWVEDDGSDIHISTDNYSGANEMMEYLFSLGHTRIGFVGPIMRSLSAQERFRGYKEAFAKKGIPFDASLVGDCKAYSGAEEVVAAAKKILAIPAPPTAIFAGNDVFASYIMSYVKAQGRSIPEDISIAGFDDMDIAIHLDPPLTTVRSFKEELGKIAAREIISLIKQGDLQKRYYSVKPLLIVRRSCGTPFRSGSNAK